MKQIGLKDDAAIVDLTRTAVTVQSLTETKVMCTSEDKVLDWVGGATLLLQLK